MPADMQTYTGLVFGWEEEREEARETRGLSPQGTSQAARQPVMLGQIRSKLTLTEVDQTRERLGPFLAMVWGLPSS